jgi:hypothetical protein
MACQSANLLIFLLHLRLSRNPLPRLLLSWSASSGRADIFPLWSVVDIVCGSRAGFLRAAAAQESSGKPRMVCALDPERERSPSVSAP